MKAVKMDMDVVNCVLLIVILALVIYCCVKQGESFFPGSGTGSQFKLSNSEGRHKNNITGMNHNLGTSSNLNINSKLNQGKLNLKGP